MLKAAVQSLVGMAVFALIIYVCAGTWRYWQGWLFLAVFALLTLGFTIYMLRYDRPLIERRMNAGPWKEKEGSQKIIVSLIILTFFAFLILPILDHRLGYSPVASWVSIAGEVLVALSFLFIFWVTRVNSWAASNVVVMKGQQVISSGPYAYVRHPMYAATLTLFIGIPLALGSWYTIALLAVFIPILLWRLLDEERVLRRDLPGYDAYLAKVRYRLVPFIF